MNKKINPLHQKQPAAACSCCDAAIDCLDFLCDCGERVSPVDFIGFYRDGIRLRACCPVCGQKYGFKLKVNFPPATVQWDDPDLSGYKIINRLRLKEV